MTYFQIVWKLTMESDDDLPDIHNWDHELGTNSHKSEEDKRQQLRDKHPFEIGFEMSEFMT